MNEEEMRRMRMMQQTPEMGGMSERGQIPLERLIEAAKMQYDMLIQLGLIEPEITPFDALKVLSGNQSTGVPGINIPAIADETIPMDLDMQLDPTVRSMGPSPEELMAEEERKREMMLRFQGHGLLQ